MELTIAAMGIVLGLVLGFSLAVWMIKDAKPRLPW